MSAQLVAAIEKLTARIARLEKAARQPERTAWRPREIAAQIGVPYEAALELIKSGELGSVRVGRHYVVPDVEVKKWLARGETPAVRRVAS
jgi:excisionase family DNA binding protein